MGIICGIETTKKRYKWITRPINIYFFKYHKPWCSDIINNFAIFFYTAFEGVFQASVSRVICPHPMTAHIFKSLNGRWEFCGDLSYSVKPFPQLISACFLPNENELAEFIPPSTWQCEKDCGHVILTAEISRDCLLTLICSLSCSTRNNDQGQPVC